MKRIPVILAGVMLALLSFGVYAGAASAAEPTDPYAAVSGCPWWANAYAFNYVAFQGDACPQVGVDGNVLPQFLDALGHPMDPAHLYYEKVAVRFAVQAVLDEFNEDNGDKHLSDSWLQCANSAPAWGAVFVSDSGIVTGAPNETRAVWTGAGGAVVCPPGVPFGNDFPSAFARVTGTTRAAVVQQIIGHATQDKHLVTAAAIERWMPLVPRVFYAGGHPGQVIFHPGTRCHLLDAAACAALPPE